MEKILVAKILKPQGIKGEVKCQIFTDLLAVFNGEIKDLFVENNVMTAENLVVRQGSLYIKFVGVNTRNDAELLRNKDVFLLKENLVNLLEDEFLIDDLIGAGIFDKDGAKIGQIVDVENYGSADILTILENNHEYQVPFIKEIFDTSGELIVVDRQKYNNNKI